MKLVAEYLEHVRHFEAIAAREKNPRLKIELHKQAGVYHRLAEVRAEQLGKPLPNACRAGELMDECG
jgi:hypothetical protein